MTCEAVGDMMMMMMMNNRSGGSGVKQSVMDIRNDKLEVSGYHKSTVLLSYMAPSAFEVLPCLSHVCTD
jgi:hypothetical protein